MLLLTFYSSVLHYLPGRNACVIMKDLYNLSPFIQRWGRVDVLGNLATFAGGGGVVCLFSWAFCFLEFFDYRLAAS